MAKTPTYVPDSPGRGGRGERGAALLEAAIALALVALIAGAGVAAFATAARESARAEAKLAALSAAESALELGSAAHVLRRAIEDGEATLTGDGWRLVAAPYEGDDGEGPLALVLLSASAGPDATPLVELTTLRSAPR